MHVCIMYVCVHVVCTPSMWIWRLNLVASASNYPLSHLIRLNFSMCLYEGISGNFQYSTSFWPEKGSPWLWRFYRIKGSPSVCEMTFWHVAQWSSSSVASVLAGNAAESAVFMAFSCSWTEDTLRRSGGLPQSSLASTRWSWLGHLLTHIVFNTVTVTGLHFF